MKYIYVYIFHNLIFFHHIYFLIFLYYIYINNFYIIYNFFYKNYSARKYKNNVEERKWMERDKRIMLHPNRNRRP